MKIIHETKVENLLNILKKRKIMTQFNLKAKNINYSSNQGSFSRRIAFDPKISLKQKNFYEYFDEVNGVYCRIVPDITFLSGDCVFELKFSVLYKYNFVFNTTENFGFFIDKEGKEGISQFAGEPGITISKITNFNILKDYEYKPEDSELLIQSDIDLSFVKNIYIKKIHKEQFKDLSDEINLIFI